MKLIKTIPLNEVKVEIKDLTLEYPQFILVVSQGTLKIYKQVR
jgi:hypothetical protein